MSFILLLRVFDWLHQISTKQIKSQWTSDLIHGHRDCVHCYVICYALLAFGVLCCYLVCFAVIWLLYCDLVCFAVIWFVLLIFGIICSFLVLYAVIWFVLMLFGMIFCCLICFADFLYDLLLFGMLCCYLVWFAVIYMLYCYLKMGRWKWNGGCLRALYWSSFFFDIYHPFR